MNNQKSPEFSFGKIKEANINLLANVLDLCAGDKDLVFDKDLMPQFSLITNPVYLQKYQVKRMFKLETDTLPFRDLSHTVYFMKPTVENVNILLNHIYCLKDNDNFSSHQVSVFFVPQSSVLSLKKLEQNELIKKFTNIGSLPLFLFNLSDEMISMENQNVLKECILDNDPTSLMDIVNGLLFLQSIYGIIPNISGKGQMAEKVAKMLERQQSEDLKNWDVSSQIHHLILFDRTVDLITPFIFQRTYEGMIDEVIGIHSGAITLPESMASTNSDSQESQKTPSKTILWSIPSYIKTRNLRISKAMSIVNKELLEVKEQKKNLKTISDMKKVTANLKKDPKIIANISLLIKITEFISKFFSNRRNKQYLNIQQDILSQKDHSKFKSQLESLACSLYPLNKILRLMCLQSLLSGGLRPDIFKEYCELLYQCYGYELIELIIKLDLIGFLTPESSKASASSYNKYSKSLIDDSLTESEENFTHYPGKYLHDNYQPISVRIVESLMAHHLSDFNFKSHDNILNSLPGPHFNSTVDLNRYSLSDDHETITTGPKRVMIFFIGGCTFSESLALKKLASGFSDSLDILIGSTSIINGDSLIASICELPKHCTL